ncbi:MAG: MarR family winged helix-turn-helix transcriptional regulator [Actinomycetes bacterium]
MPRSTPLSASDAAAWNGFLHAHDALLEQIDADLEAKAGLSLGEFEVLDHLAAADDHQLWMNELAARTRLSPSGLTRRFDALVRRGWVTRSRSTQDGRGILAVITVTGLSKVAEARPVHARAVRAYFLGLLSTDQVAALAAICGAVVEPRS